MVLKVENSVGFLNGSSDILDVVLGMGRVVRVCQWGSTKDEEDEKERTIGNRNKLKQLCM